MVIGRWWQDLRRQRERAAVARRPIPDDLWKRTLVRYPFLRRRDGTDATELRRLTSLFLDRKEFAAAGGLKLTDAMVVAIAAQAVLPVLRLGLVRYDGFVGIVVHEYDEVLAGEAMAGGPLMLSWQDVRAAGRSAAQGYNVVIHEFAHVLDMADGLADGVPLLPADIPLPAWRSLLQQEYGAFVQRIEREEDTVLDPYGAEGEDEFFAVASEAFFVHPQAMQREHPGLYGMFARFYLQDPAAETAAARRSA